MKQKLLNLAAYHPCTQSLGPGKRAAVWVQGCPFRCPGCIAPSWQEDRSASLVDPVQFAAQIAEQQELRGLTISGGEPMQQAGGLLTLVKAVKEIRDLDVICFSGYKIEMLINNPPNPEVEQFLDVIDVLIDGLYVDALNNDLGLRGSENQRIHHLTNRIKDFDFENAPRKVELVLSSQDSFLVGVPTTSFLQAYEGAFEQVNEKFQKIIHPIGQNSIDNLENSP